MKQICLAILLIIFGGCTGRVKNCGEDLDCFIQAAKECRKAKVKYYSEGYTIWFQKPSATTIFTLDGKVNEECYLTGELVDIESKFVNLSNETLPLLLWKLKARETKI